MNTTDRVKEIIRDFTVGDDSDFTAAASVLDEEFVIIPRTDLPDFKIIDRKGEPHVDCGSDWGTWNVKHVDRVRETALEYVGAFLTAEKWHAEQEEAKAQAEAHARQARREELAKELGYLMPNISKDSPLGMAIDRIIELEQAAA